MSDVWDDESTEAKVPRDRWGRPQIVGPKGGKPVAYTRATTFAGSVEDMFGLGQWQQRMVAIGLTMRKDLLLAAAAHADGKDELNRVVDQAREAAAASAAATTGTALHKLAERYDRGQMTLEAMPESNRDDMQAYAVATAPLTVHGIEQFVVLDGLQVAGTFDRIVEYGGQRYVADIKTGSIEYGTGKMAIQLALYSRGRRYEHGRGSWREDLEVSQNAGIIIHLPAGRGQCDLYWIDLTAGWEATQLCDQVRAWRKRKRLLAPASFPASAAVVETVADAWSLPTELGAVEVTLEQQIAECQDREDLEQLWSAHRDEWTDEHTKAAAARKLQLHQGKLRAVTSAA